jgi:chemotaxis protein methyltransferase CheR
MPRISICSEFFLEPEYWKALQKEVLPYLTNRRCVRSWSAGCYTGKEPYSLAILMKEAGQTFDIVGTDRDPVSLERAVKGGPFSERDLQNVTEEQRGRWFRSGSDGCYVIEEIMSAVIFRRLDLLEGDYPKGFDLILYRYLETCFSSEQNEKVYSRLVSALNPGGVIFVGGVDRIPNPSKLGLHKIGSVFYKKSRE